jgi:hypothetical protein
MSLHITEKTRGEQLMERRSAGVVFMLGLCLLLLGCSGETNPQLPPDLDFDQQPLSLASPFFDAGYELVGYYELDADADGVVEMLAVLTVRTPAVEAFSGGSAVLLFGQHEGAWMRANSWKLDGVNASAELHDLTGDGLPEVVVAIEEADRQLGDFVTPLRYTDHLIVFTYTPGLHLVELGTFSSSLVGVTHPKSAVETRNGRPVIHTFQDLPPAGTPLWWPFRVETFAWDGQAFSSVHVEERHRISPVVSWVVGRNAPWAAAALALGSVLSLVLIAVARRWRWQERWIVVGLVLLLVIGGIVLSMMVEWLCVPGLVVVGLAGLGIGRRAAARLVVKPNQDQEVESGG